ncbi:MAG: recombinase family protein, partial [Lachnospiraceae bacterium]|nr:recombinase family protein [Lachnospiraceae bacterium]
IAAAKARGVKFGRPAKPLPENFYEIHKQWREKKLTMEEAAFACGMPTSTFHDKAKKYEGK